MRRVAATVTIALIKEQILSQHYPIGTYIRVYFVPSALSIGLTMSVEKPPPRPAPPMAIPLASPRCRSNHCEGRDMNRGMAKPWPAPTMIPCPSAEPRGGSEAHLRQKDMPYLCRKSSAEETDPGDRRGHVQNALRSAWPRSTHLEPVLVPHPTADEADKVPHKGREGAGHA